MNNVAEIFESSKSISEFSRNYLNYLSEVFKSISDKEVESFISKILKAREEGRKIIFMGNGGSAATANHIVNDIAIGTRTTGKPFRAISLSSNMAVVTALGNDNGYDEIFLKQLQSIMTEGDLVVAISASGNSKNLLLAIEYANENGADTAGFTGFDGGKLKEIAKSCIHAPTGKGEYGPVEDMHMIFTHIIGNFLAYYCKKND